VNEPLLEVRGLRLAARAGTIVESLDLELRAGETVALVGESGSGKSMTAKALVGLLPRGVTADGEVRLRDRELLRSGERTWRRIRGNEIALLLQDPFTMLNPLMRVGRQLTETVRSPAGGRLRGDARTAEAVRRLAEVGIRDPRVVERYPFELSGGMRQRVGLASALASDPEILVADEPSTALDVTTQREILRLIRRTQERRGMALLLITHDLRVAFAMSDRVYVLYAGALLESGSAAALEAQPLHPYSHGLLTSEPPLEQRVVRLASIGGTVPSASDVEDECAFAARCRWVEQTCRAARPPLLEIEPGRHSACRRIDEIRGDLRVSAPAGASAQPVALPAAPDAPLVAVTGLVKEFNRGASTARVLDDVSIAVDAGEAVGLVGESGSGKTTLARCLVGLEGPTAGRIEIAGVDASSFARLDSGQRAAVRRTVQMVFQDPYSTLNPARTVGFTLREALTRGGGARTADVPAIAELLERVGLPRAYATRKPAALSGGERQRVAIARALALRPRVLICDEPVSALDVSVQAQILNLLSDLRESLGLAYLFITHDLAVVRQVTDRVYVLAEGEVVEAGATASVLDEPRHAYTRTLLASVPRSDPTWLATAASASTPV
jgi:peptide/nickel transport system ATP-binding protein